LQHAQLTVDEISKGLNENSGLSGLAGGTGDMREILARRDQSDADAALAFDIYIHRLRQQIGAMTASLGGLDVLAFTGGIGQNIPIVRAAAANGLGHLGVAIDDTHNATITTNADITARGATASCLVVTTGEHFTIAEEIHAILATAL
jgi:acetate kinase